MVCVEMTTRQSLSASGGLDRRDEVGEALADAGAGLDHQVPLVDGTGDGLGHVELLRPALEIRHLRGDGAAGTEDMLGGHASIVTDSPRSIKPGCPRAANNSALAARRLTPPRRF